MRMLDGLVHGQDRSAGHALLIERRDRVVARWFRGEPVLDDLLQFGIVVATAAGAPETRVGGEIRHAHGAAQLNPLMRRGHAEVNVLIATVTIDAGGAAARMLRT